MKADLVAIPDSGSFVLFSGGGNGMTSLYVFGSFFACIFCMQHEEQHYIN